MGVRPRLCKGGATIGLAWHNRQPSLEVHRMMMAQRYFLF